MMAIVAVLLCLLFAACGGSSPAAPSTPPPANPYTITISASGVVGPTELIVPPGTRVLFVNGDSRRHNMTSDPHPDHSDCPEINQVGTLNVGASRETGNLNTVRTCGFHDHDNPGDNRLKGRIVVR